MATTLFKNGSIVDGSGKDAFDGSVLIEGDSIRDVIQKGENLPEADTVIDASGLVVAPGFIDMHSHADWVLPARENPDVLKCLVEQGVTSIVGGNCGFSPAPILPKVIAMIKDFITLLVDKPFEYKWDSMAGFFDHVDETGPVLNMAELAGHAAIRFVASDTKRGKMPQPELDKCLDLARQSLDEGACGLSFGLGYDPGMYSPLEELAAFCAVAAQAGKPVAVHLKALSWISPCYPVSTLKAHNVLALEQMLDLAARTGVRLQISHFIFVGRRTWPTAGKCIRLVEEARRSGVDVMVDAFPFTCGNTTINVAIPYWFLKKIPEAYHSALLKTRLKMELELGFRLVGFNFNDFQIMDVGVDGWEDLNGRRITEIAKGWKVSPFTAFLKIAEASKGAALMLYHTYSGEPGNEKALEKVLSKDYCLFETDAIAKTTGFPNPAAMGTFPRILGKYVRDKKMLRLEDAIKRMTSASAERFGLTATGSLEPGKAADMVLFDPATISDSTPEGSQPAGRPTGIGHVFINGAQVVKDGAYIDGVRAGRALRC